MNTEPDLSLTAEEFAEALQKAKDGATDPGFERRYRRELNAISQRKIKSAQADGSLPVDLED